MAKTTQPPTINFGWDSVNLAIDSLAYMLKPLDLKGIIGVARGGLIPATMLSHRLNIPMQVVHARSYGDKTRRQMQKVSIEVPIAVATYVGHTERTVVVDDVIDSADTHDALREKFPKCQYACIVNKRPLLNAIHFCHVPVGVWVKFPWEVQ